MFLFFCQKMSQSSAGTKRKHDKDVESASSKRHRQLAEQVQSVYTETELTDLYDNAMTRINKKATKQLSNDVNLVLNADRKNKGAAFTGVTDLLNMKDNSSLAQVLASKRPVRKQGMYAEENWTYDQEKDKGKFESRRVALKYVYDMMMSCDKKCQFNFIMETYNEGKLAGIAIYVFAIHNTKFYKPDRFQVLLVNYRGKTTQIARYFCHDRAKAFVNDMTFVQKVEYVYHEEFRGDGNPKIDWGPLIFELNDTKQVVTYRPAEETHYVNNKLVSIFNDNFCHTIREDGRGVNTFAMHIVNPDGKTLTRYYISNTFTSDQYLVWNFEKKRVDAVVEKHRIWERIYNPKHTERRALRTNLVHKGSEIVIETAEVIYDWTQFQPLPVTQYMKGSLEGLFTIQTQDLATLEVPDNDAIRKGRFACLLHSIVITLIKNLNRFPEIRINEYFYKNAPTKHLRFLLKYNQRQMIT